MDDRKRLELITEAVRYCRRVRDLGMPAQCYTKALREPVFFLWERRAGSKVQTAQYRSRPSLPMEYGTGQLVYDHAVPFRYLQEELLGLAPASPEAVEEVLNRFGTAVLITKDEDRLLTGIGLGHRMPEDWVGADPLARYRAAGIELVQNPSYIGLDEVAL